MAEFVLAWSIFFGGSCLHCPVIPSVAHPVLGCKECSRPSALRETLRSLIALSSGFKTSECSWSGLAENSSDLNCTPPTRGGPPVFSFTVIATYVFISQAWALVLCLAGSQVLESERPDLSPTEFPSRNCSLRGKTNRPRTEPGPFLSPPGCMWLGLLFFYLFFFYLLNSYFHGNSHARHPHCTAVLDTAHCVPHISCVWARSFSWTMQTAQPTLLYASRELVWLCVEAVVSCLEGSTGRSWLVRRWGWLADWCGLSSKKKKSVEEAAYLQMSLVLWSFGDWSVEIVGGGGDSLQSLCPSMCFVFSFYPLVLST